MFVSNYPWLNGDQELLNKLEAQSVECALNVIDMCKTLWTALPEARDFGDCDFTIRQMTSEEANFKHSKNDEYDNQTSKIIADILNEYGCEFGEPSKVIDMQGLHIVSHCGGYESSFWWGEEYGRETIHIRQFNSMIPERPFEYRDHQLYYRDCRDKDYILTMKKNLNTWNIDSLPNLGMDMEVLLSGALWELNEDAEIPND